ncbi:thiamine diphosphokinase [Alkalibacillus haloalkaliphilus]|uniref:thiamine diphosphokinase n=1 Tax=Alkalibacillus haloalkaliphilus TaxID=94136 RepID=UPI0029355568|nr:thiamine diphosphokinase [Alkalibacillus haloalkaliphilus]MDV2582598.1 thiamine diphosphokinase [Alkalibacillus haloalkaliphilus]
MKVFGIVAGGPKSDLPPLNHYEDINHWIGVDHGAYLLSENVGHIDLAIGDFDSVSTTEFSQIKTYSNEVEVYPVDKDDTDLELAINYVMKQNPDRVYLFGATGGRKDHEIVNIMLLKKFNDAGIEAWVCNVQNELTLKTPGQYELKRDERFQYVSFLPISDTVCNLNLKGFLYELDGATVKSGSSLTVSNEWKEKIGTYFFTEGILIIVKSRD